MAYQQMSDPKSPLRQHPLNQVPGLHVVHRFPEMSSFLMLQHHGHTLDFSSGPRLPYQTCLGQPIPVSHVDSAAATPSCHLVNALPCHTVPNAPCVINNCQSFSVPSFANLPTAPPHTAATTTSLPQPPNFTTPIQATFVEPRSPPPPTRKLLETRKRSNSKSDDAASPKYPRKDPSGKIEFRPLLPNVGRRPYHMSRSTNGNRVYLNKHPPSGSGKSLAKDQPYKFEFNIPFPPKPKDRGSAKRSHTTLMQPPRSTLPVADKFPTMWPLQPTPKQGYISVLEQAINQLSERCSDDASRLENGNDGDKENVQSGVLDPIVAPVTKESLDQAWLTVLDRVFGKSDQSQPLRSRNSLSYTSSGTSGSGYPSESYSELDWTTSTMESDCVSGAEQEVTSTKDGPGVDENSLDAQIVPSQGNDQEDQLVHTQDPSPASGSDDVSSNLALNPESNTTGLDSPTQGTLSQICQDEQQAATGSQREDRELATNLGKEAPEDQTQNDEFEYSDEDDVRDEQEEEKATDADVETEFMSSAEHEPPKWSLHKPRLLNLKRSVPKSTPVVYRPPKTESSSGNEGFATPMYQCSFPTSSDSDATQGNGTPSQARKPQPPFKSPGPVDPKFRGVTVQIRTKVEENKVQLSVKGFFNCRKKSKQRTEYAAAGQGTKSSSDSDSTSNSDSYRNRKRRSYQSGKQCASCWTKKTPLWRDAEDGTPLCNACGIRYKKYRVRCHSCWYIPRKDVKMNATCSNCGEGLRLSAMRNPAKVWT